jgi:NADH-quinone oxidoreductase subunit E
VTARVGRIDLRAEAGEIIARYPPGRQRSAILELLHLVQDRDGWVGPEGIREVGEILGLTAAEVRGVASFYTMLHTKPKGRHVVSVCQSLACAMLGAERVVSALEDHLGVDSHHAGTTTDGRVTLERAECLAACDRAPVVQVDYGEMPGPVGAEEAVRIVEELRER